MTIYHDHIPVNCDLTQEEIEKLKQEMHRHTNQIPRITTKDELEEFIRNEPMHVLPNVQMEYVGPKYDYELIAEHTFRCAFEIEAAQYDNPSGLEDGLVRFIEKKIWIFKCSRTGELKEIVHSGPYDPSDCKE